VALGPEDGLRQSCVANFHNIMTVNQEGVGRRLTQLSRERLREVCAALNFALGCDR
jgi:mRNA-degrading endonuclease toxin of MazEF toxin-antitoxin module